MFEDRSQNYRRSLGFLKIDQEKRIGFKAQNATMTTSSPKNCISMCSKVQRWLAQCEIAQDRLEVINGIVVFSVIVEDI